MNSYETQHFFNFFIFLSFFDELKDKTVNSIPCVLKGLARAPRGCVGWGRGVCGGALCLREWSGGLGPVSVRGCVCECE